MQSAVRRVAFRFKDYRTAGADRWKTMTLASGEFLRRFLVHVLPKGLQRIRHYGLLTNAKCVAAIAKARELLDVPKIDPPPGPTPPADESARRVWPAACPCCSKRLFIIEIFARGSTPRTPERIDTS